MAKDKKKGGMSLRPSEAVEGSGAPDGTFKIAEARFTEDFDYGGTREAIPALLVKFEDESGETKEQGYSVGKAGEWEAIDDGLGIAPTREGKRMAKSSSCMLFINSLVEAGFDEEELDGGDISVIDGTFAQMTPTPIERKGLEGKTQVLSLVTEIVDGFGKGKGKPAGKSAGKDKPATGGKGKDVESVEEKAEKYVVSVLKENKGTVKIGVLAGEVYEAADGEKKQDEIAAMLEDDDWFKDDDRPWEVDKKTVKLKED